MNSVDCANIVYDRIRPLDVARESTILLNLDPSNHAEFHYREYKGFMSS